ncbi:peptide methionine sulfoxide reductase MsrA [Neptunitalea chrysea]|uniref:Peptide methionine sulfoxide reductase MsrA n=1 Tax=Neptunitalea chrysea TaxID=1647581 RepID=A0A9W6EV26_9FLAO|nr:peptide-methionine (S)-S-oxide reductase MsrA [Neptunitalea chrysea]GLB52027.1 peptide methionine sulfoxide reductase MsrA [Neptunitalea chrysea]
MKNWFIIILSSIVLTACNDVPKKTVKAESNMVDSTYTMNTNNTSDKTYKKAYFASGCFWCVEAIYESIDGVKEAISGYSGGTTVNPTYEEVSTGTTGHAETVEVVYDPKKVSFKTLVKAFFDSHDPTTLNQQGPDRGPQYRSIAFYKTAEEKKIIEDYIAKLTRENTFKKPIVTEVKKFAVFWEAEAYHQNYEEENPFNPYIKRVSKPRLEQFKKKFNETN